MKVILIKQVEKLGCPGDIVDVAPGFGRNFLIAKGLAREATQEAIAMIQSKKKKKEAQKEKQEKNRTKLNNILEGQVILVRAQANKEGHLFGGVGAKEIAQAIAKRKKIDIDQKQINLPHHLKTLGKHDVVLRLKEGDSIKFIVDIQEKE